MADIAGMTAATDVLRFGDLDVEVRDLIARLTDADPDEFEIRWHHRAGDDDVTALIGELTEVEAAADTARRDAIWLRSSGGCPQPGCPSASSPTCSACPTSG